MTRVLGIHTPLLGNATYAALLRALFADAPELQYRSVWSDATRAPFPRALACALTYPGREIAPKRYGWDGWSVRYEFAASTLARAVARAALAESPADVLHFHTQNVAWRALDLMRRIPTVISADMTAPQAAEQETAPGWRWTHGMRARMERRAFRAATAVVAFSCWAADGIIREHGVDPDRVAVIHPGIRRDEFAGFAPRDPSAPPRLLFVGGEFERKGGPLLVDVFRRHIAGDGVALDLVTQAPIESDAQIRVHRDVVPFSPRWRALYHRASALVVPTLRDASSHVAIEAMAAGLPVITTPVGGIPEIVVDGETGFLVPPGDGATLRARLTHVLGDAALRERMGAAGRARVAAHFDARANGARLAALYERIAMHA